MTLAELIRGRQSPKSREPATATPATVATQGQALTGNVARVATVAVAIPPEAEAEALPDPRAEARRQRVLAMLSGCQAVRYAVLTDSKAEPDAVILALAIRGVGTCELRVPRKKYDGFLLLDLIARHGAAVH
jgi:hypothetical protein